MIFGWAFDIINAIAFCLWRSMSRSCSTAWLIANTHLLGVIPPEYSANMIVFSTCPNYKRKCVCFVFWCIEVSYHDTTPWRQVVSCGGKNPLPIFAIGQCQHCHQQIFITPLDFWPSQRRTVRCLLGRRFAAGFNLKNKKWSIIEEKHGFQSQIKR